MFSLVGSVSADDEKEAKEKNPLPDDSNEEANMLMETDVGIIEYLSKLSGFSGIIKQR